MKNRYSTLNSHPLLSFLILAFLSSFALQSQAAIWTLSNNPLYKAQFNSFNTAQTNATAGDTILISGSPISYGIVTLSKKLVLIGSGYNNPYGENTVFDRLSVQSTSAAGSEIMGIDLTADTRGNNDITFNRCYVRNADLYFNSSNAAENIVFLNCIITGFIGEQNPLSGVPSDSIYILNSILDSVYIQSVTSITIRNSVFINQSGDIFPTFTSNFSVAIENSIVYEGNLNNCNTCLFSNNIFASGVVIDTTLSSIGFSGNFYNTNPLFVSYPGGAFSYAHNYFLQASSPGVNAGSDGNDIGISGGIFPYEVGANPRIPQMTELNLLQSSIPINGTLQFDFKAKTQN